MTPREFFEQDTVAAARALVGRYLVRRYDGVTLAVRITETEAYIGRMDRACHAYNYRRTPRTQTLFAPAGTAYIYLIYGLHCCLNLVTEAEGEPAAVLIRGGQVRHNGDIIAENRFGRKLSGLTAYQRKNLLNGPGKLCAALRLDRTLNGLPYGSAALGVYDRLEDAGLPPCPEDAAPPDVKTGTRIGIDYAGEDAKLPWRFYL